MSRETTVFSEFVAARSRALLRTAYLITGEEQLAQDLVQEALAKTYVALPRLRDLENLEAYTRKAMASTAVSWWRRKSWQNEKPRGVLPENPRPDASSSVDQKQWLWDELKTLPPRQRLAIVLRYYEDLSQEHTAEVMGCAVGTVKSQVALGLSKLRERLGPDVDLVPDERIGS